MDIKKRTIEMLQEMKQALENLKEVGARAEKFANDNEMELEKLEEGDKDLIKLMDEIDILKEEVLW